MAKDDDPPGARGDAAHAPTEPRTETADAADAAAAAMAPGAPAPRLAPIDPERYHVVREVARGGLGRIIEVRDLRIGRVVAVKEMLRTSDVAYARFVREAMITARLEHPAIVPVHDVGRWPSGEPFYSMKLVSGRSLHDVIVATPTLGARLALLPNVIAVADAIAYAHSQGIIHRDLKPANVVVGEFGETVVIDWGLAKDLGGVDDDPRAAQTGEPRGPDAAALTMTGGVLGTPCYMPPEQARGQPVDQRADVYALGALLYEVLAGAPPYADAARPLDAVLERPPAPLELRAPGVPPDLAAIAHQAMARLPERRYPSARELAEDLRRFQTGHLVRAHVYTRRTLARRWLRRYRAPVLVAAAALAALAVAGGVGVTRVIAERDVARRRANQLLLTQVRGTLERDATAALAWLRTYPADGDDPSEARTLALEAESRGVARHAPPMDGFFAFTADNRAWVGAPDGEHLALYDVTSGAPLGQLPHHGHVESIVASPDGHTLAVLDWADTAITLVDVATGGARRQPEQPGEVTELTASPDGRWIATGSSDGRVRLAPTGAGDGRALGGHDGGIFWLAFSRDSRWLLSMASGEPGVRLWQVDGAATRALPGAHDVQVGDVSPDGALVVLAHQDGAVSLWSAATGAQVRSLHHHVGKATWVAFSPDGRWIASSGSDGVIVVTAVATGAERPLTGHSGEVASLAFSPDSTLLASGGGDGDVRLWAVDSSEQRVLGRHVGSVFDLAFSPDGHHLASRISGAEHDTRIWDVETRQWRGLQCHRATVFDVAFSPDGRWMATGSDDNSVCLWDPRTGQGRRLEGHDGLVYSVAFSPDGTRLASASFDGSVRLWELGACGGSLAGCEPVSRALTGHRGSVWQVAFSPDGRRLATAGSDATVRLWDPATGEAQIFTGHARVARAVAFSPDGRQLASAGEDHDVRLWDVATGATTRLVGHADRVDHVAFSPDGRSLLTASDDQSVRLWDVATGGSQVVAHQLGLDPVFAMSPDGRWIAASGAGGRVILVDRATLAAHELGRHRAAVTWLAFSPDGARLASAGRDHTVRLWDPRRALLDAVFLHEREVLVAAFSPDGQAIAAVGSSAVVRTWPTPARGALSSDPRGLAAWIATRSTVVLGPRERVP